MANIEVIATNLLTAAAYGVGAYLAVEYVLPRVKVIAAEVLRYPKTAEALVFLLSVLVYLVAAEGIITSLVAMGLPVLNYVNVLSPAIVKFSDEVVPTLRLLLIGIGAVILVERIRLRA
ncbi:hypothetical protein HYU18_01060 [Candidatus Woesearchaeota archaeon]|nr:hypothetical protein [Candidatus Woesearchaeota archaeon]